MHKLHKLHLFVFLQLPASSHPWFFRTANGTNRCWQPCIPSLECRGRRLEEGIASDLTQFDSHDTTWSSRYKVHHIITTIVSEVQFIRPSRPSEAWIIQAGNWKHYKVVEISGRRTILPPPWVTAPPSIARKLLWNLVFWLEVRRDPEK